MTTYEREMLRLAKQVASARNRIRNNIHLESDGLDERLIDRLTLEMAILFSKECERRANEHRT